MAKSLKYWILPLLLLTSFIYFSIVARSLPFNKVLFQWFGVFMLAYWLISGFVFFIKKYQHGKYTSVIQRFWRRSFILFWVLELFLLFIVVFLTFNASQETYYMLDNSQIFKTHFLSWRIFLLKIIPMASLIILTFYLVIILKSNILSKTNFYILLVTMILTYICWLEFYHFFHVTNFYGNLVWQYDNNDKIWVIEQEVRRTRIVNHYMNFLVILKFLHILFIYTFWVFFVLRGQEIERYRYPLLSANIQNFIMLYLLTWIYMYPWFKWFYRRYFDLSYKWLYENNRVIGWRVFFNDIKILLTGFYLFLENIILNLYNNCIYSFQKTFNFFYWKSANNNLNYFIFKKNFIKNNIVSELVSDNYYNLDTTILLLV